MIGAPSHTAGCAPRSRTVRRRDERSTDCEHGALRGAAAGSISHTLAPMRTRAKWCATSARGGRWRAGMACARG